MGQLCATQCLEQDRIESRASVAGNRIIGRRSINDRNGRASDHQAIRGTALSPIRCTCRKTISASGPWSDGTAEHRSRPTAPQGDEQAGEHGQDADEIRTHDNRAAHPFGGLWPAVIDGSDNCGRKQPPGSHFSAPNCFQRWVSPSRVPQPLLAGP